MLFKSFKPLIEDLLEPGVRFVSFIFLYLPAAAHKRESLDLNQCVASLHFSNPSVEDYRDAGTSCAVFWSMSWFWNVSVLQNFSGLAFPLLNVFLHPFYPIQVSCHRGESRCVRFNISHVTSVLFSVKYILKMIVSNHYILFKLALYTHTTYFWEYPIITTIITKKTKNSLS